MISGNVYPIINAAIDESGVEIDVSDGDSGNYSGRIGSRKASVNVTAFINNEMPYLFLGEYSDVTIETDSFYINGNAIITRVSQQAKIADLARFDVTFIFTGDYIRGGISLAKNAGFDAWGGVSIGDKGTPEDWELIINGNATHEAEKGNGFLLLDLNGASSIEQLITYNNPENRKLMIQAYYEITGNDLASDITYKLDHDGGAIASSPGQIGKYNFTFIYEASGVTTFDTLYAYLNAPDDGNSVVKLYFLNVRAI
jgi:predicted secreted protein